VPVYLDSVFVHSVLNLFGRFVLEVGSCKEAKRYVFNPSLYFNYQHSESLDLEQQQRGNNSNANHDLNYNLLCSTFVVTQYILCVVLLL